MRLSREAGLLLALLPLALAASLLHRPVTGVAETCGRAFSDAFDEASRRMPVLDAVRVRSDKGHAAQRLRGKGGFWIEEVLDAGRALEVFKYGRLLHLDQDGLRVVSDRLAAREVPDLPPLPEIANWFVDGNGPFDCDVLLRDDRGVATVREVLPEASLWGEPVARVEEEARGPLVTGALLFMIALSVVVRAIRRDPEVRLEARILAVLAPLALLGLFGWGGADGVAILALAIVFAADRDTPLWVGAVGLLFPIPTLKRMGLVLLVGWACRRGWARPRLEPRTRSSLLRWCLIGAAAAGAILLHTPLGRAPESVRTGQAVRFGGPAATHELVPPPVDDPKTKALLNTIYQRADRLARNSSGVESERFREVAYAAAVTSLHLPRGIAERVQTTDGHEAIWRTGGLDPGNGEWHSAELYRLRADLDLRRHSLWAAFGVLLLFGAFAAVDGWRDAGAVAAALIGGAVLFVAEGQGLAVSAEQWLPLVAVAAVVPTAWIAPGLVGAAILLPSALGPPAAALLVTSSLSSWAARRRSR